MGEVSSGYKRRPETTCGTLDVESTLRPDSRTMVEKKIHLDCFFYTNTTTAIPLVS